MKRIPPKVITDMDSFVRPKRRYSIGNKSMSLFILKVSTDRLRSRSAQVQGKAYVQDQLVAEAEIRYALVNPHP